MLSVNSRWQALLFCRSLMRVYREYGNAEIGDGDPNSQTLANLTYSQTVALFAVLRTNGPNFFEENELGTVSSRQFKEAIQAWEEVGNELIRIFRLLDKDTVLRGKGEVLCIRPELSAVDAGNYIVPIWTI